MLSGIMLSVIMLSVIMLRVIILSVFMLSGIMLSGILLSVIVLKVVAPFHPVVSGLFAFVGQASSVFFLSLFSLRRRRDASRSTKHNFLLLFIPAKQGAENKWPEHTVHSQV
jgi:hypothetical protein